MRALRAAQACSLVVCAVLAAYCTPDGLQRPSKGVVIGVQLQAHMGVGRAELRCCQAWPDLQQQNAPRTKRRPA